MTTTLQHLGAEQGFPAFAFGGGFSFVFGNVGALDDAEPLDVGIGMVGVLGQVVELGVERLLEGDHGELEVAGEFGGGEFGAGGLLVELARGHVERGGQFERLITPLAVACEVGRDVDAQLDPGKFLLATGGGFTGGF